MKAPRVTVEDIPEGTLRSLPSEPIGSKNGGPPAGASSKTTIVTNTYADWHDLLDEVFASLVAVNAPQPALFQRGLRLR